ncbi:MAG: hypothetical protein WKF30_15160 [Pyrinomonadaceae bacterium]
MISSTLCSAGPEVFSAAPLLDAPDAAPPLTVAPATNESALEVLRFLSRRPLQTVVMSGLIHDNGIVSPFNRGTFFVCRDVNGKIEGVALCGHNTLVEAQNHAALVALARAARDHGRRARMIMGEEHVMTDFWKAYAAPEQKPLHTCVELLFELRAACGGA